MTLKHLENITLIVSFINLTSIFEEFTTMPGGPLTLDPNNEIVLWTKNGECRIQLLSGDITQLPVKDKVDIIMVSAFPGDYAPMSGTVIGALQKNLNISVRNLAYNKELDLRHHFSCWMSKEITSPDSPFKKLLCFEKLKSNMSIVEQVSQMFRVFVPVFNNQDNTVITPLLATGHQSQSEQEVCKTMVKAGAYWINAGLPMRELKIVVYGNIGKDLLTTFQKLKTKLLKQNQAMKNQITKTNYDIYVSYHPHDEHQYVSHIVNNLKKQKSQIKLFATVIQYDHEAVWQKDIFNAMVSSKRIIVVLTALFLESPECLEQYNMALCCNRLKGGDVMAPLYVENIKSLPSYMTLVQWIDCRERKEGDNTVLKIQGACSTVIQTLDDNKTASTNSNIAAIKQADQDKYKYDVFISYSHKTPKEAKFLFDKFEEIDPSVKVFYDKSALTTGSNWQEMLYSCMGQCKCAIALLSPNYLTSTICMEEYNLALARFLSQDKGMKFLPILIEHCDDVPAQISAVDIMDAIGKFDTEAHDIAECVTKWLTTACKKTNPFPDILPEYRSAGEESYEDDTLMEKLLSQQRSSKIDTQYKFLARNKDKKDFVRNDPVDITKAAKSLNAGPLEVVVSFSNDSSNLASVFCSLVDLKCPNVSLNRDMHATLERMAALDKASVIVVFVSKEYMITESHMHELHLALLRQRSCDNKILYLIKTTPLKDIGAFFPRILPYDVSMTDKVWKRFEKDYLGALSGDSHRKTVVATKKVAGNSNYATCDYSEFYALSKATDDVTEILLHLCNTTITHKPMLLNLISVEMEVRGKSPAKPTQQDKAEFSKNQQESSNSKAPSNRIPESTTAADSASVPTEPVSSENQNEQSKGQNDKSKGQNEQSNGQKEQSKGQNDTFKGQNGPSKGQNDKSKWQNDQERDVGSEKKNSPNESKDDYNRGKTEDSEQKKEKPAQKKDSSRACVLI